MLNLAQLFKCLSDETRLRCLVLLQAQGELCVCELTGALQLSQPKISRHLAQLRAYGLLQDRRQGLWVYYRIHPQLPAWAVKILRETAAAALQQALFQQDKMRLSPSGADSCCTEQAPDVFDAGASANLAANPA